VEINGFLKKVCAHQTYEDGIHIKSLGAYKCAHSDRLYSGIGHSYDTSNFDVLCDNDPHFYQVCGVAKPMKPNLRHGGPLCNKYICAPDQTEDDSAKFSAQTVASDSICGRKHCPFRGCTSDCKNLGDLEHFCVATIKSDEQVSGEVSVPKSRVCNGWCDLHYRCDDEALCGGFVYGMFCKDDQEKTNYVRPQDICNGSPSYLCANNEDEADCPDLKTLPNNEKCNASYKIESVMIPILNRTRCTGGWRDDISPLDQDRYLMPICKNYLDQTNCTDPNRFEIYVSKND
jgi:hypothetical protein